ncbi:MAG: sodium-dependent transporter [Clostridia bacterium]|nr:sodium-dependent transporter [Clostridia bacterium]
MSEKRSSFTGKIGFVLAAAGSAVGLGNIWRFPYLAAKYGGGIFLLVYIILAITFGFSLMCAEIAIGRKTGQSAITAFKSLDKRFSFVGWLCAVIPAIILPYYSVIGGWVMKYFAVFITGGIGNASNDAYFGEFIGKTWEPIGWFFLFFGLTALTVMLGVQKGVESVSKVMMPVLVVLTLFVATYSVFMPNAMEGVKYYLIPNFKDFSVMTVLAAMGQLFYSMSLAMGIMITYGSYMKKEISIEKSVRQISIFDTGIAFLAGIMVILPVFSVSGNTDVNAGPGLMFQTLPKVFASMTGGGIIGTVFFLLVLFAAFTSSISLMETVVSIIADKTNWNRKKICLIVFLFCLLMGIPSSLGFSAWSFISVAGMSILDMFDFASNSVLMPLTALVTCIFVGYYLKPKTVIEEIELSGKFTAKKMFVIIIKYVAPVCIVLILISSVLNGLSSLPIFEKFKI